MKTLFTLLFSSLIFISSAQSKRPFENYKFDSSYKIISIASKRVTIDGSSRYNFCITDLNEMNLLKKTWKLPAGRESVNLEDSSISVYVVKGKELVEVPLLIFPQQSKANYKNAWSDFDMQKILAEAQTNPLKCHDKYFQFYQYSEYTFFEDSIQSEPNYLFMFKPSVRKNPGYFDIYTKKDSSSAPEVNALESINKELARKFPNETFEATVNVKDTSSDIQPGEFKIRVQCSKNLYDRYKDRNRRTSVWTLFPFEARVYFKD